MNLEEFNFDLPEHLIAQTPLEKRDHSLLMIVNREKQTIEHKHFYDLIDYLNPGDVLVRNNSKVIPARLLGVKENTGAKVELLLLEQQELPVNQGLDYNYDNTWLCLVGNAKVVKLGSVINFGEGKLKAECIEIKDDGMRLFKMHYAGVFMEVLDELGTMPLPPYIKERLDDKERYQTVYAKVEGSSAAPTAGFHFTEELLKKIEAKNIQIVDVTLHIGLGTFRPVKVENILDHQMHSEYYVMDEKTASILNQAKKEKRRIISIGTTATRVLETVYNNHNKFKACSGYTDIFIYPGYDFKAITCLITNFHLPKSTLIMLVSALASQEFVLKAYKEAVEKEYRFFSFGDSMFIC